MRIIALAFLTLFAACQKNDSNFLETQKLADSIRTVVAPDKRVALFNIEVKPFGKNLILTGETDQPIAYESFKVGLDSKGIRFLDSVHVYPEETLGEYKYAVVNNSVANIRSNGWHSAELATQELLGTPLKVLTTNGTFYLVQVPDKYISWVDHGGIKLMTKSELNTWNEGEKVIYQNPWGYVYKSEQATDKVSDIVMGAKLKFLSSDNGFFKVEYPDGRIGYIKTEEASLMEDWLNQIKPTGELIETYAKEFMGTPYLWGGTSSKGVDCSGFTKTVYLMNGFIIPRDASQQMAAGKIVDPDLKFEDLEKGDLMFFGSKATENRKQRVSHVGIWLGNDKGEFIHSSKQVRLSSVLPDSPIYDEGNTNAYLGSRRYLNQNDPEIQSLKEIYLLKSIAN